MRSNAEAFYWLEVTASNEERREYPIREESPILAMSDIIVRPPYPADAMHSHNCMEIGLCISGQGVIHLAGQGSFAYKPGTVSIIPEGLNHCSVMEKTPETRWRYIAVDQSRLMRETTSKCREGIRRLIGRGSVIGDEETGSDLSWLIQRMFEIKCGSTLECTGELEAILLLILMRSARDERIEIVDTEKRLAQRPVGPVEPALLYIAEQYHTEIKIAQLARSCAMSESHFRKVFTKYMGASPVDYLNRYRIERAAHIIRTGEDKPISRIAEECGFPSIATFNRNFLRYIGQSPTDWKRNGGNLGQTAG